MKPITKLYLKAFLWQGITYGLLMGLFKLSENINKYDGVRLMGAVFLSVFVPSLVFGALTSWFLVYSYTRILKKNGIQEMTHEHLSVPQKIIIKSKKNIRELIEKIKADPVFGKMKITEGENKILIRSGIRWRSLGENIKITINSIRENEFEYLVSSSPKLKIFPFEGGIDFENVYQIKNIIKPVA